MNIPPSMVVLRLKALFPPKESSDHSPSPSAIEDPPVEKSLVKKVQHLQSMLQTCCSQDSPELSQKNSDCFWCTCAFQGDSFYIPAKFLADKQEVRGYGHFCSPNCALAFLYQEQGLTDHERHERDELIHLLFRSTENQERFRPSPDPRLLLSKFCGTLEVEEFRKLFSSSCFVFPTDLCVTRQWKKLAVLNDPKIGRFFNKQLEVCPGV